MALTLRYAALSMPQFLRCESRNVTYECRDSSLFILIFSDSFVVALAKDNKTGAVRVT